MAKKIKKNTSVSDAWLFGVKHNRYVMGYSEAEHGSMVVYAATLEEAEAMLDNGDYTIEDEEAMHSMCEEDYDDLMEKRFGYK